MRSLNRISIALIGALFSLSALGCSGGKDEEEDEPLECCMLKALAENCDKPNASSSLRESIQDWETVGESGDADACTRMVEDSTLGCSGTLYYGEDEALVDCAD